MNHCLRRYASRILDLIYPPSLYCICCGKVIDDSRTYRLCNNCIDNIKWIDQRTCLRCGKQLSVNNPGHICFNCLEYQHSYDNGYTCTEYGEHERNIIFALKYDGRTDIAATLAEIIYDRLRANMLSQGIDEFAINLEYAKCYDEILPVPIHSNKRAIRGFNQAELIAQELAARLDMKCNVNMLERVRETHIMRALGPDARKENIRGAFAISSDIGDDQLIGKSFLIVDDIYTTGATIDEIASIVKAAGARRVDFVCFSSGADMIKVDIDE